MGLGLTRDQTNQTPNTINVHLGRRRRVIRSVVKGKSPDRQLGPKSCSVENDVEMPDNQEVGLEAATL